MKWWLKLYTIPSIISFSKWLGLTLTVDLVLFHLLGFRTLNPMLYFFPIFMLAHTSTKTSFRANLEFHKMSVPFPVLKKAFYTHLSMLFVFIVLAMLMARFLSELFGTVWLLIPSFTFSSYAFFGIAAYVGLIYFNSFTKAGTEKYGFWNTRASYFQRLLQGVLAFIFFVGLIFVLLMIGISAQAEIFLIPFSIIVGAVLFYSRSLFHQTAFRASKKQYFGYWSTGLGVCLSLFFFFAYIGKDDYQNKSLSIDERVKLFFFWQPMSPDLDKDLFVEFEPNVKDPMLLMELYDTLPAKELNEISVSHFISPTQPWRLNQYIMSGKVNGTNLATLLDHMKDKPEWWIKHYKNPQQIQNAIVLKWPKQEPFPEHLLKRSIASAPKEVPVEKNEEGPPSEEPQQ